MRGWRSPGPRPAVYGMPSILACVRLRNWERTPRTACDGPLQAGATAMSAPRGSEALTQRGSASSIARKALRCRHMSTRLRDTDGAGETWRRGTRPPRAQGRTPLSLSQFVAGAHAEAAHGERGVPPASAVAASKTTAAYGRWASVIGGGTSVVPSIMPGSSSPLAADNLIEINSGTVPALQWRLDTV